MRVHRAIALQPMRGGPDISQCDKKEGELAAYPRRRKAHRRFCGTIVGTFNLRLQMGLAGITDARMREFEEVERTVTGEREAALRAN